MRSLLSVVSSFRIDYFPFDMAGQFCRQWMGGGIAERDPKGCPETDAFRGCVFECVREQADAQDDFVGSAWEYGCAVFGQKFSPELDLILVPGLALGGSDA